MVRSPTVWVATSERLKEVKRGLKKSMVANEGLDDARHEVLAENTAQAVYKHLTKLFQ